MLRSLTRAVLCLAVGTSLMGCYSVRVSRPDVTPSNVSHVQYVHTFIYGILSVTEVNATMACGKAGIQSVHSYLGGLGLVAGILTGGLWTPMTVVVVCAEGEGGMVQLPEAELAEAPESEVVTPN